jgi:hypothetical protein
MIKRRKKEDMKERQIADLNYTLYGDDNKIYIKVVDGKVVIASEESGLKVGDNLLKEE